MEKLEAILKNYLNKGSDRIDVTAVLSLIKIIKEEQAKQLTIPNFSQQRELLLAFFDLADELPMGLSNYDREKIVEEFLANNCG